jgi:hypothetical protein
MNILHFALKSGGFLFLGNSESVDGSGDMFMAVDKEAHVYQSRAPSGPTPVYLSELNDRPCRERPHHSASFL